MSAAPASRLAEAVGSLWTSKRAADALGVTPEDLENLADQGVCLLLTTTDGARVAPLTQFTQDRDGHIGLHPALAPLLCLATAHDPWAVAVMLNAPAPELNDQTPVTWARSGNPMSDLETLAAQIDREWSA